jgi:hypothetical protein
MSMSVGRFRRMPGTAYWISPIRSSVVARARRSHDADGGDWQPDVATYGVAAFGRALDVRASVDLPHMRLGLLGRTVQVMMAPLCRRVLPHYYVRAPDAHGADEVFVTLLRDGDYPDLVLAGGIPADRVTGSHIQLGDLDEPLAWLCRLIVQDNERRAAA